MNIEKCKNCPHFKSYYHGFGVGSLMFSHRCWWTGRDPADMADEDCRRSGDEDDRKEA